VKAIGRYHADVKAATSPTSPPTAARPDVRRDPRRAVRALRSDRLMAAMPRRCRSEELEEEASIRARGARARAAAVERAVFREVFAPRERMTLLEWAEKRRYLSPGSERAGGRRRRAGALLERDHAVSPRVMLALSDPETEYVVCKFPSQDGKTEILNNFVGWRIDTEPGPMLVLQPTKEMAETWSKDRLAPMIRDTPQLRARCATRARATPTTRSCTRSFPAGTSPRSAPTRRRASRRARSATSSSTKSIAARRAPAPRAIRSASRSAARRRSERARSSSSRRRRSKATAASTSRVQLGTQEEWHVPCPHCGTMQFLEWGGTALTYGLKWDPGEAGDRALRLHRTAASSRSTTRAR
jgi:phage terminase large subunit GpA-like protein